VLFGCLSEQELRLSRFTRRGKIGIGKKFGVVSGKNEEEELMTASHAPDAPNLAQLPSSENKATSTLLPPRGRRLSSGESRRAVAAAGSLQRERRLRGLAGVIRSLSLSLSSAVEPSAGILYTVNVAATSPSRRLPWSSGGLRRPPRARRRRNHVSQLPAGDSASGGSALLAAVRVYPARQAPFAFRPRPAATAAGCALRLRASRSAPPSRAGAAAA